MNQMKVIIKTSDFVNTAVVMFLNRILLVVTAKYVKHALDVGKKHLTGYNIDGKTSKHLPEQNEHTKSS